MTTTIEDIAWTTGFGYALPMSFKSSSPFDDALADLRVSGSVLLFESYRPPWAIVVPGEDELRPLLGVGPQMRLLPFHLVIEGAFELTPKNCPSETISAHEVVICTRGDEHVMSVGRVRKPTPFAAIYRGERPSAASVSGAGASTKLLCGVFLLNSAPLNPLLGSLPPVLKIMTAGVPESPMLMRAADMLALEVGGGNRNGFTAARLIEVFCAEAIAAYRRGDGAERTGWFKALDDKKVGNALAHLHREPEAAWTVELLAKTISMSPSRFAARFRETTGQSVMSYVAIWRMNVACRLLRETEDGLAEIAQQVGYQDVTSFSRAFKVLVGESPSKWRGLRAAA
jgi:AraC-like DNA-binding protein